MPVAEFNLIEYLIFYQLLPFLFFVGVFWLLGRTAQAVGPRLARAWQRSALRTRYLALSKASLVLCVGVGGNLLELLLCLPLLRIPFGTAIKPMSMPPLIIFIAAVSFALGRKITTSPSRAGGPWLIRGVGFALCLTPFFVGFFLMHLFAAMRNLQFG
jgi:hypothetical protein